VLQSIVLMVIVKLTTMDSQPNEKPLRTKRGHRKPSFLTNLEAEATSYLQGPGGPATHSPSGSDAFSLTNPVGTNALANPSNGHLTSMHATAVKPKSGFDVYCNDLRDVLIVQNRKAFNEGTWNPDRALAQGWQQLDDAKKAEFQRRYENLKNGEKDAGNGDQGDEDIEMDDGNDTEVAEDIGGFTAVNRE
jgi:non-histone protein 10